MRPLRETDGGSPLLRHARALLDSTEALPESRERMLRVRRALDQRKRGGVLGRVPAAVTAGVLMLFGASAFAAVRYVAERSAAAEREAEPARRGGKRVSARPVAAVPADQAQAAQRAAGAVVSAADEGLARDGELQARAVTESRPVTAKRTRARTARARHAEARNTASRSSETLASQVVQTPAKPAAAAKPAAPVATESKRTAPTLAANELAGAAPAAPEDDSRTEPARDEEPTAKDGELVHRALQALRRKDDPALAARLLAQHRKAQPSGALAEEALSLQIEAAVALEDPRALMFAREYLARYPHGRYVHVARNALAGGR